MTKNGTTTIRVSRKVWEEIWILKLKEPNKELNDFIEEGIYFLKKERGY